MLSSQSGERKEGGGGEALSDTEKEFDLELITDKLVGIVEENLIRFQKAYKPFKYSLKHRLFQNEKHRKILDTVETYFQNYYDSEKAQPNREALREVAKKLLKKVDLIKTSELWAMAQRVVDEATTDHIVLYIRGDKFKKAKLDSPNSENSNEFMAKMVAILAKKVGKTVEVVTDETVGGHKDVVIIDDAMYSGAQMKFAFGFMERHLQNSTNFTIYCARSTQFALNEVQEGAQKNGNASLEIKVGQEIKSLFELIKDDFEIFSLLVAPVFLFLMGYEDSTPEKMWKEALYYLNSTTLTISETKTPDLVSFPTFLAIGHIRKTDQKYYPSLPV